MPRHAPLAALTLLPLAALGCVQRTISITSQPEGALVYLNDEEVGRTPLDVPFTFYGTYDVRLERGPEWVSVREAAAHYGVTEADIRTAAEERRMTAREREDGGVDVQVAYSPLWTTAKANPPLWEHPGPDLIAEAIPGAKSEVKWHFELEPAPVTSSVDTDQLLDHARQLQAKTRAE